MKLQPTIFRNAVISPDQLYRYSLIRRWGLDYSKVAFVLLNPSTADATKDDPTIRRCIRFAQRWGYDGMVVLNIFALRSTDPKILKYHPDPIGPQNREFFLTELVGCGEVICGWGAHGKILGQGDTALKWIRESGHEPKVWKLTKDGQPWHPLYLKSDLMPYTLRKGIQGGYV